LPNVTFDPGRAAGCLAAERAAPGCDTPGEVSWPGASLAASCSGVFVGSVDPGGGCSDAVECRPPLADGVLCAPYRPGQPSTCIAAKATLASGDLCTANVWSSSAVLRCSPGTTCDIGGSYRCQVPPPDPNPGPGQPCTDFCAAGAYCSSAKPNTCMASPGAGEPCGSGVFVSDPATGPAVPVCSSETTCVAGTCRLKPLPVCFGGVVTDGVAAPEWCVAPYALSVCDIGCATLAGTCP
jgi:hypothetical protein